MSVQSLLEQLLQSGVSKVESAQQSGDRGKYAAGAAERAYLDELARQLQLDAGLKAALEAKARAG